MKQIFSLLLPAQAAISKHFGGFIRFGVDIPIVCNILV
jgi:hypothetical protein